MTAPTGMRRFDGRVAIVTGGASGIGLATVLRFATEGATVVIADLDVPAAERAAMHARDAGAPAALGVGCDVSDEKQVVGAIQATLDAHGRLDAVVNNAGLMIFNPITLLTGDEWMRVLSVDLLGAFYFTKHAFQRMANGGAIVNVSSIHAVETVPHVAAYAAAKAALVSLTRSAALEGSPLGIRVNVILPGAVDTPMLWDNPTVKSGAEVINPADVGKPEDIAAVIAYLASDDARFVQGAAVRVDGGRLNRL